MNWTRVALLVLAVAALAVVLRLGVDEWRERALVAEVDEAVEDIRTRAARRHPGLPEPAAMEREASERVAARLAAEPDGTRRRVMAAGNFFGLYFLNTRQRPAFCRELGVDIGSFVAAFEGVNAKVLAAARAALEASPLTEAELYAVLEPQLQRLIDRDMADLASRHGVTAAAACRALADDAGELTDAMDMAVLQPEVHAVLME